MTRDELRREDAEFLRLVAGQYEALQLGPEKAAELRRIAALLAAPYPPDTGRTHWPGCWRERGHHNCAVEEVERLMDALGHVSDTKPAGVSVSDTSVSVSDTKTVAPEREPMEMFLCESERLILRPDQPYIFRVDPKCDGCLRIAAMYDDEPGTPTADKEATGKRYCAECETVRGVSPRGDCVWCGAPFVPTAGKEEG